MSLNKYLSCTNENERIDLLEELRVNRKFISEEMTNALILLPISEVEKFKLISITKPKNGLNWEKFLIDKILDWPQNISARLIRTWTDSTARLLYPLLQLNKIKRELPQRIFYTIIDVISPYLGKSYYESYAKSPTIMEYSPALHGLMMLRCIQFNSSQVEITKCAEDYLEKGILHRYSESKGLLESILYLARFNPEKLTSFTHKKICDPWNTLIVSLNKYIETFETQKSELLRQLEETQKTPKIFLNCWPILPLRYKSSSAVIEFGINFIIENPNLFNSTTTIFDFLGGFEKKELIAAFESVFSKKFEESSNINLLLESVYGLLGYYEDEKASPVMLDIIKKSGHPAHYKLFHSKDPNLYLKNFATNETNKSEDEFKTHKTMHSSFDNVQVVNFENAREFLWSASNLYSDTIVDTSYTPHSQSKYWSLLINAICHQEKEELEDLTIEARKQPYLIRILFIRALGKYAGKNEAALRLMDFIRSKNNLEISEVLQSLAGIDTPRSLQDLISSITRPNLDDATKLEACKLLQNKDVSKLQPELKALITDLDLKRSAIESWHEIRDTLKSMLEPNTSQDDKKILIKEPPSVDLDERLEGKIPFYRELSTEVKRALRTGQFFYDQVTGPNATENIEISPIIDMVYKALELQFRESFESMTMSLIQDGRLQRKLDVIGYARPIPKQMEAFEDYISKLQTINEIPFFSKFKLRKMLRALCQFRPGKRFTLDGVKAFALFFLCFSRKSCNYGLNGLIDLGFQDDRKLFNFVKSLHILQDFRNRAVHEGFRPEARDDIEGIWASAGEIFNQVFIIKSFLESVEKTRKSAG